MAIERFDLNECIGCRLCINICPMDVFRFDETANKSIIAYPENCQACGMCYFSCLGGSLQISLASHMFPLVPMSATCGIDANHVLFSAPNLHNAEDQLAKTGEFASEPKIKSTAPPNEGPERH